jgi:hypothetical protein
VPYVLSAVVLAVFAVVSVWRYRQARTAAPIRDAVRGEALIYRAPISPQWGRRLASGMELVVREHSFEISYPFPGGRFLTQGMYCVSRRARMETGRGRFRPPRLMRDCIVLTVSSDDDAADDQEVRLSSWQHQLRPAWDALASSGVVASGPPPEIGT